MMWHLDKYARLVDECAENQQNPANWQIYTGDDLKFMLTTNHHIVISKQDQILENMSLWNCHEWMKGVFKGDSLLIVVKIRESERHRKFRVKFKVPEKCGECVLKMKKYFPIRNMVPEETILSKVTPPQGKEGGKLEGEVMVGKINQVLSSEMLAKMLPRAYRSCSTSILDPGNMSNLVKLCLTDSNFPGLVKSMDKSLQKL